MREPFLPRDRPALVEQPERERRDHDRRPLDASASFTRAAMWIRSVPLFVTLLWSRKWTSRLITQSWASPKNQIMNGAALR